MQRIPMTLTGAEKLREELHQLKNIERRKISEAIGEARKHGDLRENGEYHAAKELQAFMEGRIREIEHKLSNAQIIDISSLPKTEKVVFGVTVVLINLDNEQKMTYQIVGDDEADLKAGKISVSSPIARAIIGKMEGDSVDVHTPNGVIPFEIESVKYI